jgi:hypothetical protein
MFKSMRIYAGMLGLLACAAFSTSAVQAQTFKTSTDSSAPPAVVEGVYGGKLMRLPAEICATVTAGAIVPCSTAAGTSGAVSQASTTSGQQGMLDQCATTTAAPTYTTGTTNALSCDVNGGLRLNIGLFSTAANQATLLTKTLGGRLVTVKGAWANGSGYGAASLNIGPLITISTGQPSTTFSTYSVKIKVRFADVTTAVNPMCAVYDALPSSSTFTDGVQPVIATADVDKVTAQQNTSFTGLGAGSVEVSTLTGTRGTTDASGNFYMNCITIGPATYVANTWRYEFSGQY